MTKGGIILNMTSIVVISLCMIFYMKSSEKKIAFVKISSLYEDFQMKKDLEGKFENTKKIRKNILDSLELSLKLISKKLEDQPKPDKEVISDFEARRQNYFLKKKQFEEDNEAMIQQFTQQITKQLNQYVESYGKEKHYTYILGADGSGIIMHADDAYDVTADVLKYVNSKYKGGV